jgi:hypothetical protein
VRRCAAALLGAALAAAGVSAGGSPAMALTPGGVPGVVMPGISSNLRGVYCTSAVSCWAVGSFDFTFTSGATATLNQILRWNGTSWSQVKAPSPGGTADSDESELNAVRCRTAGDCWAVGDFFNGHANVNQSLHWNGSKWAVVPVVNPGGTESGSENGLSDIVCPGASTCWAAGQYGSDGGDGLTLNQLLRWNGTKWTLAKSIPQPAGTSAGDSQRLNSIRCTSTSNCLAVGTSGTAHPETSTSVMQNEALRWNGTTWSSLAITSPGGTANGDFSRLTSLACTSATNCWAAGSYGSSGSVRTSLNQIMHWNGATWSLSPTIANPDGSGEGSINELLGATCTSATDCWVVGDYGSIQNGTGEILNQTLHWDGTAWTLTLPPDPGGIANDDTNTLNSIRCNTTANCWAVGSVMNPPVNQALRWNGTMWSAG